MQTKQCLKCNKPFTTNRKEKVYCSNNCRELAYKKRKYAKVNTKDKTCEVCGESFSTTDGRTKYCSSLCAKQVQKKHVEKFIENNTELHKEQKQKYKLKPSIKDKIRQDFKHLNNSLKEESIQHGTYYEPYTDEEDTFLLDNWNLFTKAELAEILNRTYASVKSRYKKITKTSK